MERIGKRENVKGMYFEKEQSAYGVICLKGD